MVMPDQLVPWMATPWFKVNKTLLRKWLYEGDARELAK